MASSYPPQIVDDDAHSAEPGHPASPAERPPDYGQPVSNLKIAVVMMLAMETMFFSGLIGAFIVLRGAATQWPPPGQPMLPIAVTWANTAVLLASAVTMFLAARADARGEKGRTANAMAVTAFLGLVFLFIQGTEWVKLILHGLTLQSSTYGASFYTLIGTHGVHVAAAVAWLLVVLWRVATAPSTGVRSERVELCAMYWYYVCALWPVLFGLVYFW